MANLISDLRNDRLSPHPAQAGGNIGCGTCLSWSVRSLFEHERRDHCAMPQSGHERIAFQCP